ncbi:MAG: DHA2 family efflux MFS transporter permease subunit [Alphaproteobacteria bacterium]|nr:DHA2 family efflux MFS transporter permease subunit [Alphaproteobacteria bacterium]
MIRFTSDPCDKGVIATAADCPERQPAMGRWVLVTTILGSSIAFIDGTVVNVALPALQRELGASVTQVQWVVEAYALLLAALILAGGAAGDRFGRRRMFVVGMIIFTIASAWCGYARSANELIAARALQGLGGALLVPGSLSLISATFPVESRGKAIGTWSAFTAITMAVGPLAGGWLIENASWRWIFWLNIPFGIAVVLMAIARVPDSRNNQAGPLDLWGTTLGSLGLAGVVFALIEQANLGWMHPVVLGSAIIGLIATVGFIIVERRITNPMLPPALFGSANFVGANVLTLFLYGALGGALFFLPLNAIQVQGMSATQAGASLLPFMIVMFLMSRWAGSLVDRYGPRLPLIIGPAVSALGFLLLMRPDANAAYLTGFFPGIMVLAVGMAISVSPLTTVVMTAVPDRLAGIASGVNNAVSRAAGLVSLAIFGALVYGIFHREMIAVIEALDLRSDEATRVLAGTINLAAMSVPPDLAAETQAILVEAIKTSFVTAFRWAMGLAAALAALSVLSAALWIGREPATEPDVFPGKP